MSYNKEAIKRILDPKFYLENFCKIKGKQPGSLVPFILNQAQRDLFNTVREFSRVIILKSRQIGFCLDPNTKILTSDYRWVRLNDIKVGQEIVSVDENVLEGRGSSRKMRKSVVEDKCDVFDEAYKIIMSNGEELIATGKHKFLFQYRGAVHTIWRKVCDARVGDKIRNLVSTWEDNSEYDDGWFGGIIDGEGSLCKKNRTGSMLTISQVDGPVWDRIIRYAQDKGINFRIEYDKRLPGKTSKLGSKTVNKMCIGSLGEIFRVIGICKPSRMINRDWWDGKKMPGNGDSWHTIVSIEKIGKRRMIDLQTSKKTYIANGFVSHNSTAMVGFFYHNTIMNPGTNTAIIGYNADLTAELLDKVKTFYRTTPAAMRPTIKYDSKHEISFPRIDSKILVLPSTVNVGRGYTLHNVLATELSAWENADEKMMTLEASVPINGHLVIESTPRGVGNLYHRMWCADDNGYAKKEYGWWWGYTRDEIEMIRKRMNNPQKFAQEYGLEFLASGRSVFDSMIIAQHRRNILKTGDVRVFDDGEKFTVMEDEGWRIYKQPEKDGIYVMGADVSEGVFGGDYSVAVIFDRRTGEEVAFYRKLIPPDRFGEVLNIWGRKYNNALMTVEVNNHGLTTLLVLKQKIYPNFYFRLAKYETPGMPSSDKIGWKTTSVTRPLLIDDLAQAMRDKLLTVHSKEILDEMMVMVYDDGGNIVCMEGFHDDCVFASGIGYQGFKMLFDRKLSQLNYEDHLPMNFAY